MITPWIVIKNGESSKQHIVATFADHLLLEALVVCVFNHFPPHPSTRAPPTHPSHALLILK